MSALSLWKIIQKQSGVGSPSWTMVGLNRMLGPSNKCHALHTAALRLGPWFTLTQQRGVYGEKSGHSQIDDGMDLRLCEDLMA
jgi:hypothetical protein